MDRLAVKRWPSLREIRTKARQVRSKAVTADLAVPATGSTAEDLFTSLAAEAREEDPDA
jgi:hypothetical protein